MTQRWATFDCYGTLIDWERGIAACLTDLWPDADPDDLLHAYHDIEPEVQAGSDAPYSAVLVEVLREIADREQLELDEDDHDALVVALPTWPVFDEVPAALTELRERGWKLAILSNTDPYLLDSSITHIGVTIDERITVAEAGSYKPARGHWDAFFDTTAADRSAHIHVGASLFHDIEPTVAMDMRCVWINRADEETDVQPTAELPDLSALPATLDGLVPA